MSVCVYCLLMLSVYPCPGILVEGIGTLLDGIMGTGNGTTSTSINVGVVGLTKVSDTHSCAFLADRTG